MARYKCPCCGAAYNGKKCRNCLYENFSNEISCSAHHKGTVFDEDSSVPNQNDRTFTKEKTFTPPAPRTTAPRLYTKTNTTYGKNTGVKKNTPLKKLLRVFSIFFGIVILINVVIPLVIYGIYSAVDSLSESEPEVEITMPAAGTVLYDDGSLLVKADWEDGDPYTGDIAVYVQNNTDQDLHVSAQDIVVNGYLLRSSYFGCSAEEGETAKGYLLLNEDYLEECGIETVAEISLSLYVYDMHSYESYTQSKLITLTADTPVGFVQSVDDSGDLIWEPEEGIRVIFRGYQAYKYSPDEVQEGALQFFIENNSDRTMEFYAPSVIVNGEEAELSFWCNLMPGTRTITQIDLYGLEDLDIETLSQIQSLEVQLKAEDCDNWQYTLTSQTIALNIAE